MSIGPLAEALPVVVVGLALFGWLLLTALLRVHAQNGGYDMGYFTQAAWLISEGQTPFVTIRGLHLMADHAYFVLYPIAWLTKIFPTTATLLFVQSFALAATVVPLRAFCRRVAGCSLGQTWTILLAFAAFPALHNASLADFHPEAVVVPLFVWAAYEAHRRRWWVYAAILAVIMISREDIVLTVAGLGILVAVKDSKRAGLITAAAALSWLAFLLVFVMPHFGPGYTHSSFLGSYGSSISEAVKYMATHPLVVLGDLARPEALEYGRALLAPLLLIPLIGWIWLLPAIPLQVLFLVSTRPGAVTIDFQYQIQMIAFLFMAAAVGLRRLNGGRPLIALVLLASSFYFVTSSRTSPFGPYGPFERPNAVDAARLRALDVIGPTAVMGTNTEFAWTPAGERQGLYKLAVSIPPQPGGPTPCPSVRKLDPPNEARIRWILYDTTDTYFAPCPAVDLLTFQTRGFRVVFFESGIYVLQRN